VQPWLLLCLRKISHKQDEATRTGRVMVVNSETGIMEVGDLNLIKLNESKATAVCGRREVPVAEADRLQSIVVRVERVRVNDEGRVEFEVWKIVRGRFWINAEDGFNMADVPVSTVCIHQGDTCRTFCIWDCVPSEAVNHPERLSASNIRRQNEFIERRDCHSSAGVGVHVNQSYVHRNTITVTQNDNLKSSESTRVLVQACFVSNKVSK